MYSVQPKQLAQTLLIGALAVSAAVAPARAESLPQKTEPSSPEAVEADAAEKPAEAELETVPAAAPTEPIPATDTPTTVEPAAEIEPLDVDTLEVEDAEPLETEPMDAEPLDAEPLETEPEAESVEPEATPAPDEVMPEADTEVMPSDMPEADVDTEVVPETDMPETDVDTEPGAMDPTEEPAPAAEAPIDTSVLTVVEVAGSSDAFETLVAAIEAADLTEQLSGEGPFTVFAPTDEAFAALPEGTLEALLLPENKETLVQILNYHVVPETVVSTDLQAETDTVMTVEGSEVTLSVVENSIYVNEAAVLLADVPASNGIVHVINQVIIPPELLAQLNAPDAPETTEVSDAADSSSDAEL